MGKNRETYRLMRLSITRVLLWFVMLLTLVLLGVFIFALDPSALTSVGEASFFGLWFIFLTSLLTLGLLALARRFLGEERATLYQGAALRQSVLLALFLTGVMTAQYFSLLTWWGTLLLLVFLLLIELTYRHLQLSNR